jgi:nitroreductase
VIEKAVLLAGRAPSLHNSQPWRWEFDGKSLRLFSVPSRMLPATDPYGRQMLISCGIAVDHLRAAMAAAGWRCIIARFPAPNRRNHLARVDFVRALIVTEAERDRADAIVRRLTGRTQVPQAVIRVGIAPESEEDAPATPRLPLADILTRS